MNIFSFASSLTLQKSLLYVVRVKTLLHVESSHFGSYQNGWDACGFVIKLLQAAEPRESKTNV